MSARKDHERRVLDGVSEELCWRALFDEIDRLRAFERLARERLATTESQLAAELAYEKAWMNGVADAVEHLGFDREAACGPADLLPGLKWLVERTDDCTDDCVHAPMCRKWGPTCPICNDTGHIDDDAGRVPCPACVVWRTLRELGAAMNQLFGPLPDERIVWHRHHDTEGDG